jgi:hypothetical protein
MPWLRLAKARHAAGGGGFAGQSAGRDGGVEDMQAALAEQPGHEAGLFAFDALVE